MPTASSYLGRRVLGDDGRDLGRIVDLICESDEQGRQRVVAAVAVRGPWGRLLGYEREQMRGPWLLEILARWILRREMTIVDWPVRLEELP